MSRLVTTALIFGACLAIGGAAHAQTYQPLGDTIIGSDGSMAQPHLLQQYFCFRLTGAYSLPQAAQVLGAANSSSVIASIRAHQRDARKQSILFGLSAGQAYPHSGGTPARFLKFDDVASLTWLTMNRPGIH
jgi:hypothetical protein